jgi:hypothetical protein
VSSLVQYISGSFTLIIVVLVSYTAHGAPLIRKVPPAGIVPVSGNVTHYLGVAFPSV